MVGGARILPDFFFFPFFFGRGNPSDFLLLFLANFVASFCCCCCLSRCMTRLVVPPLGRGSGG